LLAPDLEERTHELKPHPTTSFASDSWPNMVERFFRNLTTPCNFRQSGPTGNREIVLEISRPLRLARRLYEHSRHTR